MLRRWGASDIDIGEPGDLAALEEKIALARARAAAAKNEKYSAKARAALEESEQYFDRAYDARGRSLRERMRV